MDTNTTLLDILAGQSEDDAEFDEQEGVLGGVAATLRLHVMVAAKGSSVATGSMIRGPSPPPIRGRGTGPPLGGGGGLFGGGGRGLIGGLRPPAGAPN